MKKRICTLLSLLLCLAMLTACSAANNGKDTPDAEMSGDSAQTETETPALWAKKTHRIRMKRKPTRPLLRRCAFQPWT